MLIFIIPLRSAKTTDSWGRVSQLFERTLRSVCHQTCEEFRVIVVCHDLPDIQFDHPNIAYLPVDFPIPTWERSDDYSSRRIDKQKKIFMGLTYASRFNPSHIMFVDADDCVSKHLAQFVSQNSESIGWMFSDGYEYTDGSSSILLRQKVFYYRCGTSNIVKYNIIAPDKNMKIDDVNPQWLFHGGKIEKQLQDRGHCLDNLPFPGAVYITNNGANLYTQRYMRLQRANSLYKKLSVCLVIVGKRILSRPLTDTIREEFCLYNVKNSNSANAKYLAIK
ncbi:glycosyltransferase family 2 protein [Pleurocapsales cyanobacterium LEGE 10410]|nr:glycosyltransferase family 2 protein [Pleurocapsales cyanobacterium LEGE 10410]